MKYTNGKMQVLDSDLVVCVDVDDTLVSWQPIEGTQKPHPSCYDLNIEFDGVTRSYWVFPDNIQSLVI